MKAYILNLNRSEKRREHIIKQAMKCGLEYELVKAVDGAALSPNELHELCDMSTVREFPTWLTPGAIGCAISHLKAIEEFLMTDASSGLIIEDDAVLPGNFRTIAENTASIIEPDEIHLFSYSSFEPLILSTVNAQNVGEGFRLLYPMTLNTLTGGVCYMIGREAANSMVKNCFPIRFAADSWNHFYGHGYISKVRCVYPMPVDHLGVKSVISASVQTGLRAWITRLIDEYEIPLFNKWLIGRRRDNLRRRSRFITNDAISPLDLESDQESRK